MAKRKNESFTEDEIKAGVVIGGVAPAEPGSEGMEQGVFEDLLESVREAGAVLRGEREAARITRFRDEQRGYRGTLTLGVGGWSHYDSAL